MSEELQVINGLMNMLKDHPDYHGNEFIDRGYELLKANEKQSIMSKPTTFRLLWKLANELERADYEDRPAGTIISRYASILDDRLENSGHSRTTDSLALYTTEQLKEEIKGRKSE